MTRACLICDAPVSRPRRRYCSTECMHVANAGAARPDRCACGAAADAVSRRCRVCAILVAADLPARPAGSFGRDHRERRAAYRLAWNRLHDHREWTSRHPKHPCATCGAPCSDHATYCRAHGARVAALRRWGPDGAGRRRVAALALEEVSR